jgi:hypothetical protein
LREFNAILDTTIFDKSTLFLPWIPPILIPRCCFIPPTTSIIYNNSTVEAYVVLNLVEKKAREKIDQSSLDYYGK